VYVLNSSSLGFIIAIPSIASTIISIPVAASLHTLPVPTTAGSSSDLAMIEEWAVFPPISVTKAITLLRSSWAVSDGVRSFVITTESFGRFDKSTISVPVTL